MVKSAVLAQAHLPQITSGRDVYTGQPQFNRLGWGVSYDGQRRTFLFHAGAFAVGARTEARQLPAEDLGIVVLADAFPTGLPEAITVAFFDLILQGRITRDHLALWESIYGSLQEAFAGIGTPYAAPPASPSPALPLRAYAGTYANDYVGRVEVVEREGAPALLMGPGKRPYPLRHFDRDVFTQEAYPEPPAPRAGVAFAVGPDGTAHSVALEYFNDSGQGALTRVSPGRLGSRRTAAC